MKRVLAACAAATLIALAGCGSGSGAAGNVDPATIAPPGALAFASFDMAPQGPERADFDAAFEKLLGAAPEATLGAAFTKATQTSGKLDYLADVRPWLGGSVSLVVTRVASHDCDFALLAASTDDEKAQAAIDKDLAGVHTETRSYRDVPYKVQDDGTANGIVEHFLVAGTERAFRSVVDAAKDGKSLADSEQWKATVGDRGDGKVGLAYVDLKGLLQSFAANLPGAQRVAVPLLLGLADLHPFVATLDAQPDRLVVDVSSPGTEPDARGPGAASSPLIESLPADAWLALAVPDVGQTLGTVVGALKSSPLIAAQYGRVADAIRARTGLDLSKDILTLGDVGFYARGKTATLVAEAQQGTLERLRTFVQTRANHRLTVTAPVRADETLGDTPLFRKAAVAIGQRPTLFVDFGPALEVAAASPHHRDDAHFARALPRLRHIEYIAAGARRDGGLDVARGVIGLR
ncbi:MAG TPA: DUF3352 domain-containing protein [Thermoleophilaceae bacterium]